MTTYQPATPHSDTIIGPACSNCGTAMRLFGLEPEKPGFELQSFECPGCQHIETRVAEV